MLNVILLRVSKYLNDALIIRCDNVCMRDEQAVVDYVAPGAVPLSHFWANWLQGKD